MKYSPCLSHSISHFAVRSVTLRRGCDSLLKCISIVHHGSQSESLRLWREGESDQLEAGLTGNKVYWMEKRNRPTVLLLWWLKAVMGAYWEPNKLIFPSKSFFNKCIRLEEKNSWTVNTVCGLKWYKHSTVFRPNRYLSKNELNCVHT